MTPRLRLRELATTDWRDVHAYASDPEVVRFEAFGPSTEDETWADLERALEDARDEPRTAWDLGVVLRRSGRFLGRCGVLLTRPEEREGTLWYILRRSAWGHGYATEAARAVAEFAFARAGVHRLVAEADPRNVASIRVMEKLGMRREGLLREGRRVRGEWCDLAVYALLDREWAARPWNALSADAAGRRARGARADRR